MTGDNKRVFAAACLGMLLFGITLISLGSILPAVIDKYGIDERAAGTLASILPAGILTSSLLFGPIVDRYGYKYLLIISAAIVMLALEGIAFSNEYHLIQLAVFAIGFGGGALNGATNALVSDISTADRGANISLLGVFFGIGALGMPSAIAFFSEGYGQTAILSVIGALILVPVIYMFTVPFPQPKQSQRLPAGKMLGLAGDRALMTFGFFLFLESGIEGLTGNWTAIFLLPMTDGARNLAVYGLSAFAGSLTVARLMLGVALRRFSPAIVQVISLVLAAAGALLMIVAASYTLAIAGLALIGMGCAAAFPVVLGYVGELHAKYSGTAFGLMMVMALIGNMLLNYGMGILAARRGVHVMPSVLLIIFLLMLLIFWTGRRMVRHLIKT